MTNETKQKELESWDSFIGDSFLKADNVENDKQQFVITSVENYYDERDESNKVRLNLESNENKFLMDLNKTNASFLKGKGIVMPKDLMEKVITFKKVLVRNPQTNKEVDGLRINSVN